MTKICANCDSWERHKQFHSSYDGKVRAWCPENGNSTRGHETCSKWKKVSE